MKGFLTFLAGAVVGAITAFAYAKSHFQQIADEEIANVREFYVSKDNPKPKHEHEDIPETTPETTTQDEYQAIVGMYSKSEDKPKPEIIPASDFGYSELAVTYTLYADGFIADEMDEVVGDAEVEEVLGNEWQNVLKYTDVVYVRNAARHCDYEIVKDNSFYAETHPEEVQ